MNLNVRSIPTDDPEYSKKLTIEEFKESCNKHLLDLKKEIITISGIFSNRFDHFNSEHISSAAKKEFSEYKIIFNSINNLEILFRFAKLAYLSRRNDDENHGLSAWSTQKVSWSEADLLSLIRQNKLLLKSIQKDYALENFNT